MVNILTGYLLHAFLPLCLTTEVQQRRFHSADNKNLSILFKLTLHWCSPLPSASKHLGIWMLTSLCRNHSGMSTKVSFVQKLDHLTLYQLWSGLVRPSRPNLLPVDHVCYQNQALTEHAYSYSFFNWRTNYNVVFTDHSSSRNSFDTETCITSALRWVIWIVFSFKRPILSPFCYPPDLLVQAEGCAGLQGCVILNLSYRTWLTKNLEH